MKIAMENGLPRPTIKDMESPALPAYERNAHAFRIWVELYTQTENVIRETAYFRWGLSNTVPKRGLSFTFDVE